MYGGQGGGQGHGCDEVAGEACGEQVAGALGGAVEGALVGEELPLTGRPQLLPWLGPMGWCVVRSLTEMERGRV